MWFIPDDPEGKERIVKVISGIDEVMREMREEERQAGAELL